MFKKLKGFLNRKGVSLSAKVYFIDALSYMALGLFSSLLMGLIVKTLGQQFEISALVELGTFAMDEKVVGAAVAVAIASRLQAPPLILFSSVFVGAFAYQLGGPAGAYVAVILSVELSKLVANISKIDIILLPFTVFVLGFFISKWVGIPVSQLMTALGEMINWATLQRPFIMSILVAMLMGLALTAPISSAALSFMLGLDGMAAGAAAIGCSAQMIGFATISYRDNGWGGVLAQGIGTSMLQIANIIKNPFILLPATLAGIFTAPIGILLFKMTNNSAGAGMGTSGFVGQFMAFQSMGFNGFTVTAVGLCHFLLPALISYLVYRYLCRKNHIRSGDLKLDY